MKGISLPASQPISQSANYAGNCGNEAMESAHLLARNPVLAATAINNSRRYNHRRVFQSQQHLHTDAAVAKGPTFSTAVIAVNYHCAVVALPPETTWLGKSKSFPALEFFLLLLFCSSSAASKPFLFIPRLKKCKINLFKKCSEKVNWPQIFSERKML